MGCGGIGSVGEAREGARIGYGGMGSVGEGWGGKEKTRQGVE